MIYLWKPTTRGYTRHTFSSEKDIRFNIWSYCGRVHCVGALTEQPAGKIKICKMCAWIPEDYSITVTTG